MFFRYLVKLSLYSSKQIFYGSYFSKSITRQVSVVEQELLTFLEHHYCNGKIDYCDVYICTYVQMSY